MRIFAFAFFVSGFVFAGDAQYCANLKNQVEYVKQQQRQKSTQTLRDRYRELSQLHAKECMSGY